MKKKLSALGWEINPDIKNKEEVKAVIERIEERVNLLCQDVSIGNVNEASLPAFWLAIQGDIDDALTKIRRKKLR